MNPFPKTNLDISVVVVATNVTVSVRRIIAEAEAAAAEITEQFEIIVVCRSASDAASAQPENTVSSNRQVRAIWVNEFLSLASAIEVGCRASRGSLVVIAAAGGVFHVEVIRSLRATLDEGFDAVAVRSKSQGLVEQALNRLAQRVTGFSMVLPGELFGLSGDLARRIRLRSGQHLLMPAQANLYGGRVATIPLSVAQPLEPRESISLRSAITTILEIGALSIRKASKGRPIYWFGRLGLTLIGLSVLLLGLAYGMAGRTQTSVWPIVASAGIVAASSVGVLLLGVLLELLDETHTAVTDRRNYRVRAITDAESLRQAQRLRDAA